jgi:hypothetical protein
VKKKRATQKVRASPKKDTREKIPQARQWTALKDIPNPNKALPKWRPEQLKAFSHLMAGDQGWGYSGIHVYLTPAAFDWTFFENGPQWNWAARYGGDGKQDVDLLEARIYTQAVLYHCRLGVTTPEERQTLRTLYKFLKKKGYTTSVNKLDSIFEMTIASDTTSAKGFKTNLDRTTGRINILTVAQKAMHKKKEQA